MNAKNKYKNDEEYRKRILDGNKKWRASSLGGRYFTYKISAIKRGLIFNVTMDFFKNIQKMPCHYCAEKKSLMGMDRENNNIGYEPNNVRPCCAVCNRMKLNYDKDFFILHCIKISRVWRNNGIKLKPGEIKKFRLVEVK